MITTKKLNEALAQVKAAKNEQQLKAVTKTYLGRKGIITDELRNLSSLPKDKRAARGAVANNAKHQLESAIELRLQELLDQALETALPMDLTIPGVGGTAGRLHPLQSLQQQLIELFWQAGFQVAGGPEVETDWYCFEALNIPPDHPARDMQDTFYLENGNVPRTHTSSVQIRYMEDNKPPIRIIAPGKVYRNEDEDSTHIWAFQQVEGLVVDRGVTLADLKGTLLYMLHGIFGPNTELRLRPNYFPYTEPSVEMDARLSPDSEWLELGGAGMVHPQVLRNVGIDPRIYSGFAFGFGIERIASIKYQLTDLRLLWRPNLKFLEQLGQ